MKKESMAKDEYIDFHTSSEINKYFRSLRTNDIGHFPRNVKCLLEWLKEHGHIKPKK